MLYSNSFIGVYQSVANFKLSSMLLSPPMCAVGFNQNFNADPTHIKHWNVNYKHNYNKKAKTIGTASFYSTVLTVYLQCTYLESTG